MIDRARRAGVAAIVVTGCSLASARAAQQLVDSTLDYPLYFTAGVHPHNAKECDGSTLEELRALAAHPRCVAVGECGLDFNRNFSPPDVQEEWFDKQVDGGWWWMGVGVGALLPVLLVVLLVVLWQCRVPVAGSNAVLSVPRACCNMPVMLQPASSLRSATALPR